MPGTLNLVVMVVKESGEKQKIDISTSPLVTVQTVKKKISELIDVPANKLILKYNGTTMANLKELRTFDFPASPPAVLKCTIVHVTVRKKIPGMSHRNIPPPLEELPPSEK